MTMLNLVSTSQPLQLTDEMLAGLPKAQAFPMSWRKPHFYRADGRWVCELACTKMTYDGTKRALPTNVYEPIIVRGAHPKILGAWWHMKLELHNNQPVVP